jgi:hypothetical protein
MIIDGEKAAPFSGTTLRMPDPEYDRTTAIIELSRQFYASKRAEVEADIRTRTSYGEETAAAGGQTTQPGQPLGEPKPNKELLAALKNPDLPPLAPQPQHNQPHPGNNDRRDRDNRGDRRNKSGQGRGDRDRQRQGGQQHNQGQGGQQRVPVGSGQGSAPAPQPAAPHNPPPAVSAPTSGQPVQPGQPVSFR